MAAAVKNETAAAVVRQPYILINEDLPTQKSLNMGRLDNYFFSDICSVIETKLQ
jgi:hypothetical protein